MNNTSSITIADVLRKGFDKYLLTASHLPKEHYSVVNAIESCHTSVLGGHVYKCDTCGHDKISYNSCRNRHCPSCQAMARARWVERRMEEVLPVPYFHVVFTIPDSLNKIVLRNKKCMYDILFKAASETLTDLGKDTKRLGAALGFIMVLHTWGQNLMDHPHIHCVIPSGGLDKTNGTWKKSPQPGFLFPVKVISRLFRGKFMDYFKAAVNTKEIQFHGSTLHFEHNPATLDSLIDILYTTEWVVYAKAPFAGPQAVIKYLGQYTHRIAISNSRLTQLTDSHVSFQWKDYAHDNERKCMKLEIEEFIRRFLLHVLPHGFVRIRYYGLFSSRNRGELLPLCAKLLGKEITITVAEKKHWYDIILQMTGIDPLLCPCCSTGRLKLFREIPRKNDRGFFKHAA